MDLLTFALGILASGIAAFLYDQVTRPRLLIEIDESGRVRDQAQGLHEFHHLIVRNRGAHWTFPGRRPAWSAKAQIEVLDTNCAPAIPRPIHARWTSQPEPLIPAVAGVDAINLLDPAKLITGRKVDIHSHDDQQISLLIKYDGEDCCHVFANESYLYSHTRWQHPDMRIPLGTFKVRVTVYYDRGRDTAEFKLVNGGPNIGDVQLTPWH